MKNTKHTPGSWKKVNSHKAGLYDVCRFDDAGHDGNKHHYICEVGPYDSAGHNAQLIASAPDLIEALEKIVRAFDADKDGRIGVAIVNDARQAISKAKGEQ